MTYNPNIPQAADIPSQSQGELLTNFKQLNTIFDVDHVPFNDVTVANRGKHDQSTYIELTDSPGTAANEVAVFSKEVGGITRLFLQQEGIAPAGDDIQLSGTDPIIAVSGHTFLPGKILLQWGQHFPVGGIVDGSASAIISYPITFGAIFSVTATPVRDANSSRSFSIKSLATVSTTQFVVRVQGTSYNGLFWFAIGTQA